VLRRWDGRRRSRCAHVVAAHDLKKLGDFIERDALGGKGLDKHELLLDFGVERRIWCHGWRRCWGSWVHRPARGLTLGNTWLRWLRLRRESECHPGHSNQRVGRRSSWLSRRQEGQSRKSRQGWLRVHCRSGSRCWWCTVTKCTRETISRGGSSRSGICRRSRSILTGNIRKCLHDVGHSRCWSRHSCTGSAAGAERGHRVCRWTALRSSGR
jgi:hypothetical protein